jgi:hypothetical protein
MLPCGPVLTLYIFFLYDRCSKSEDTKFIICTTVAGQKAQLKLRVKLRFYNDSNCSNIEKMGLTLSFYSYACVKNEIPYMSGAIF